MLARPDPMSLSEVYTSIQTGVVQGQENDIALTLSLKFYEVAPYCVMTDHVAYEALSTLMRRSISPTRMS